MHGRGFSLVEILVAVGVLAILIAVLVRFSPGLLGRAAAVRCAQNMRSLHVSLAAYVQDVGHWPQEPVEFQENTTDDASEDWWLNELQEYGATPKVWMCPAIERQISNKHPDGRPKIHYTPTPFDERPSTPYRWSTQPWLVEIGNMHGRGALICFPDGSIRTMEEVLGSRGK